MMAVERLCSEKIRKLKFLPKATWYKGNNATQCWNSKYADDMAILADSRENLSFNTQLTTDEVLRVTGMETHTPNQRVN